jgi:hypothetical protein
MRTTTFLVSTFAVSAVLSSVSCMATDAFDPLAEDDIDEQIQDGKTDVAGSFGYYQVVVQTPLGIGPVGDAVPREYVARRANARKTVCADASIKPQCNIDQLDLSAINLTGEESASLENFIADHDGVGFVSLMVRGKFVRSQHSAVFKASEIWQQKVNLEGQDQPFVSGLAVRLNPLRCISAPCPIEEAKLNSARTSQIDSVAYPNNELRSLGENTLAEGNRLIVVGDRGEQYVAPTGNQPSRSRSFRVASALFERIGQ